MLNETPGAQLVLEDGTARVADAELPADLTPQPYF